MIKTLWLFVASVSMLVTDNLSAVISYYASHDETNEEGPARPQQTNTPKSGRQDAYRITIQGEPEDLKVDEEDDEDPNDIDDPEDDDIDESKGSDEQIARNVQNVLKSGFKNYNINVHVTNGTVKLNGMVSSDDDKKAIEKAVRDIKGVSKINNQLEIGRRPANSKK